MFEQSGEIFYFFKSLIEFFEFFSHQILQLKRFIPIFAIEKN